MATRRNSKYSKVGYTHAQIEARVASRQPDYWSVHCLNGQAHKHDDQHPSAVYRPESGWYQCYVCALKGFADDRDRPDWETPQQRTYSNGTVVHRAPTAHGDKRIWQVNVNRREKAKPYNITAIHPGTERIYIVEGERCVEALEPLLDPTTEAVITSIGGAQSPHHTDWEPVKNVLIRAKIVFVPDRDKPGERYIQATGSLLGLENINVIRLGGEREDGYDVADWIEEGNETLPELTVERVQLKHTPSLAKRATTPQKERTQKVVSSAYEREVASRSIRDQIEENRKVHHVGKPQWLIHQFVCEGQTTVLYGAAGSGKSTVVRMLVQHIVDGTDPFAPVAMPTALLSEPPGKVLWWMGEEQLEMAMSKFDVANINRAHCAILDRTFDWKFQDIMEITESGDEQIVQLSPYTELLNLIDENNADRHDAPFRAIVIDSLPQLLGDTNQAHQFEERWKNLIVPLEKRGLAVIAIAHPRKDSPRDAPLEASLKGTERLFSLPRLVTFIRAAPTKDILRQGKTDQQADTYRNPIRDRFNATPYKRPLLEDEGLIGVLAPLKNSFVKPEDLLARQFSVISKKDHGVAVLSTMPWRSSEFSREELDGRSFGSAVAAKYELRKAEKLSHVEKLAKDQREDQQQERLSMRTLMRRLFEEQAEWTATDLSLQIEKEGFEPKGGQSIRIRGEFAIYDAKDKIWRAKSPDQKAKGG